MSKEIQARIMFVGGVTIIIAAILIIMNVREPVQDFRKPYKVQVNLSLKEFRVTKNGIPVDPNTMALKRSPYTPEQFRATFLTVEEARDFMEKCIQEDSLLWVYAKNLTPATQWIDLQPSR